MFLDKKQNVMSLYESDGSDWRWLDVCQGVRRLSIIISHRRKAPACLGPKAGLRSKKSIVLWAGQSSDLKIGIFSAKNFKWKVSQ